MARGYLDFSPLQMGHTNDQTGNFYSQAISNVAKVASNYINDQTIQKQHIYNEIEASKRLAKEYTNKTVSESVQSYVDNINKENIDLLRKGRFILTPQQKAQIQQNFYKIEDFATKLKGFEQASQKAIDEYMSPKGFGMYEDPSQTFQNVINSLTIDPTTGKIDETKLESALRDFSNTDTNIPGLNLKPLAPDEFVNKYFQNYKKTHEGEPGQPVFKTYKDPKLGLVKYSEVETPVDYGGFDREVVNGLASDEQGRQAFKFVQQNLTPEEQQLATAKYGIKDQFGRLSENPLNPMMMYYIKDKMGIDNQKKNIIKQGALEQVRFPKGDKDKEEKYAPKDTNPKDYMVSNFQVHNAIVNPDAKKKPYLFKGARLIDDNGDLGDPTDMSFEVANDRIVSVSKNDGSLILARDVTKQDEDFNTIHTTEYRYAPLQGNEQQVKEYLGKKEYANFVNNMNQPLSDKEYQTWFTKAKFKHEQSGEPTESFFKQMLDKGEINKLEYDRFIKMLSNDPDNFIPKIQIP